MFYSIYSSPPPDRKARMISDQTKEQSDKGRLSSALLITKFYPLLHSHSLMCVCVVSVFDAFIFLHHRQCLI